MIRFNQRIEEAFRKASDNSITKKNNKSGRHFGNLPLKYSRANQLAFLKFEQRPNGSRGKMHTLADTGLQILSRNLWNSHNFEWNLAISFALIPNGDQCTII